jgi:hypothetical protein
MEHPKDDRSNACDLAGVGAILAEHRDVQKLLEKTFGKDKLQTALELLKTGQLDEGLGAETFNLLTDAIENNAKRKWKGMLGDDPEGFPIAVMSWGGVFFVTTPEFDNIGYFRTLGDAIGYIEWNWDDVVET